MGKYNELKFRINFFYLLSTIDYVNLLVLFHKVLRNHRPSNIIQRQFYLSVAGLKNFTRFTRKHIWWSPFLVALQTVGLQLCNESILSLVFYHWVWWHFSEKSFYRVFLIECFLPSVSYRVFFIECFLSSVFYRVFLIECFLSSISYRMLFIECFLSSVS